MAVDNNDNDTIFEALREDHDKQRTLITRVTETSGDSEGRRELFERLSDELTRHAAAEERYFYRHLMEHDATMDRARHSVAEHQALDELLEELRGTDPSSPAWLSTANRLAEQLVHHLDEEEQEVFQQAGRVLRQDQKTGLAGPYRDMMRGS